jgi:hypothetical protein
MKIRILSPAITVLTVSALCILMTGCRSSKPASLKKQGETLIEVPCSGPEFFSDKDHLRASGIGESMDQVNSKDKALSEARAQLAASLSTLLKGVTDNYAKLSEVNNKEVVYERYEKLNREVVSQEVVGTKIICEKMTRTSNGNYKTYLSVELDAASLLEAMNKKISGDELLKNDYFYEKFKKTFEGEMTKVKQK